MLLMKCLASAIVPRFFCRFPLDVNVLECERNFRCTAREIANFHGAFSSGVVSGWTVAASALAAVCGSSAACRVTDAPALVVPAPAEGRGEETSR